MQIMFSSLTGWSLRITIKNTHANMIIMQNFQFAFIGRASLIRPLLQLRRTNLEYVLAINKVSLSPSNEFILRKR